MLKIFVLCVLFFCFIVFWICFWYFFICLLCNVFCILVVCLSCWYNDWVLLLKMLSINDVIIIDKIVGLVCKKLGNDGCLWFLGMVLSSCFNVLFVFWRLIFLDSRYVVLLLLKVEFIWCWCFFSEFEEM